MTDAFQSFDAATAAGADPSVGAAVPLELPPEQQRYGALWPTPAEMVSDHSAEGAPWLPAARAIPTDPPQGPLWQADHAGPWVPFDAQAAPDSITGAQIGAAASPNHQGDDHPVAWNGLNIGRPFTLMTAQVRHLAQLVFDPTGKRIQPPDAPSAPHELYGSKHFTVPRMTQAEHAPLQQWAWAAGQQFTDDPGYYGVQGSVPDLAARPQGAVAAQLPSDPYVAGSTAQPPQALADAGALYDLGL